MYSVNFEARSWNHCCSRKAVIITFSECVSVALDIRHAMRKLSSGACPAVQSNMYYIF